MLIAGSGAVPPPLDLAKTALATRHGSHLAGAGAGPAPGRQYTEPVPTERLMLLDGYGLVYRGYFALPPLTTSKGELVNGVFGFASIVLRGIQDLQPDYLAVSFDLPGPTFRHEQYAEYKATRVKMPDDLRDQFPKVREVVKALRIPVYEMPGYEADDVIGTITQQLDGRDDVETTIVTVDLDMLQLVTPRVRLMTTRSGVENTVIYDVARIDERFGLRPDQMIDYKALKGDPTDNIPGVPGVGEKTAAKLIREFGDLESLFAGIDEVTPEKLAREAARARDQIYMGRELSTIVRDLPIEIDLEAARLGDYDRDTVVRLFREYEFRTLIERLPPMAGETAEQRTEALRSCRERLRAGGAGRRPARGLGPGRATGAAARQRRAPARLDFDAVGRGRGRRPTGAGRRRRRTAATATRARAAPMTCRRPSAAAILDPGRIEVRGEDRDRRRSSLARDPARGRRVAARSMTRARAVGPRSPFAVVGTDGRIVAADGAEAADALRHLLERLGPARRSRGQAGAGRRLRRRPVDATRAAGRVRHADRGVHPERGAPKPDHRRRRRREPRPDPAAGRPSCPRRRGPGSRRCRRWPCASRSSGGSRRSRPRPPVPRGRAAADPGPRPDGGDRRRARSRGARASSSASSVPRSLASSTEIYADVGPRVQPRQSQAARAGAVLRADLPKGRGPRPATRPTRRCSRSFDRLIR